LDRLTDLAERMKNAAPVGGMPLVEAWVNHQAWIHVYLRQAHGEQAAGLVDETSAPDLCATFEWPWGCAWRRPRIRDSSGGLAGRRSRGTDWGWEGHGVRPWRWRSEGWRCLSKFQSSWSTASGSRSGAFFPVLNGCSCLSGAMSRGSRLALVASALRRSLVACQRC